MNVRILDSAQWVRVVRMGTRSRISYVTKAFS